MDRLRRSFEDMTSSQRSTLGLLVALVAVAAVVAVVAATSGEDDSPAAGATSPGTEPPLPTFPATTASTAAPVVDATTSTSVTSPTSTTSTQPATTTIPAPERQLLLRPDGIGDLYFGDDAAVVLAGLVDVLGEPDGDTGWVDQAQHYGICFGEEVRFVRWGSLQVFFSDGPTDWGAGFRHLASYTQAAFFEGRELDLVTSDGLALGSPVGDIRARYGHESVFDDPLFGPMFEYDPPGSQYLWGEVTGLEPDDRIVSISGSFACGE